MQPNPRLVLPIVHSVCLTSPTEWFYFIYSSYLNDSPDGFMCSPKLGFICKEQLRVRSSSPGFPGESVAEDTVQCKGLRVISLTTAIL